MREFEMQDDTATIGFIRPDGDLEVLAALNNSGSYLGVIHFKSLVDGLLSSLKWSCDGYEIKAYYRHDLEDVINITGDEQ